MASIEFALSETDVERIAQRVVQLQGESRGPATATAPAGNGDNRVLFSEAEAAARLSVSPHSLRKWRSRGLIRSTTATGDRPVLYDHRRVEEIAEWMARRSSVKGGEQRGLQNGTGE